MRSLGWVLIQYDLEGRLCEETQEENSYLQAKEQGTDQILLSEFSEGTSPADTLILDFYILEVWENKFLLLKPSLWYFVTAAVAN